MLNIIIVDDDIKMQNKVRDIVRKTTFKIDGEVTIYKFSGFCDELKDIIERKDCQKIYIMDIQLNNNESGVAIAKMIRDVDWDSQIIFITDHDKMFETVYRSVYNVFSFIEKFHDFDSRLENDLNTIIGKRFDSKLFCYNSRNIDLQIYLCNILYIYRDTVERKLVLVTNKNKFAINMNLNDVLTKLDSRFAMVHRACIVNKDHVQEFNWNDKYFKLNNGEVVNMLSKKYRKDLGL